MFWKLRKVAITELCKQKGVTFTNSALTKTGGFSSSGGYIKLTELTEFIKNHQEFKEKAVELAKKEYYSFSNIQTLCKRCHFATEKGRRLCYICKNKYHPQNFNSCYDCKQEDEKGYKEFEKAMDDMKSEWDRAHTREICLP